MNPTLDHLLNRWLEGELDAAEATRLRDLLTADPAARRAYYDLLLVDQMLGERADGRVHWSAPPHRSGITPPSGRRWPAVVGSLATAAVIGGVALFLWPSLLPGVGTRQHTGMFPRIEGSADSRITIAQSENHSRWEPGCLLRVDRGSAKVTLNQGLTARIEGPAAVELLSANGNLYLLEGRIDFETGGTLPWFSVHLPGGVVRDPGKRFGVEVFPDGTAIVEAYQGALDVFPRGGGNPVLVPEGSLMRLSLNGSWTTETLASSPPARPPVDSLLFLDEFRVPDNTPLAGHQPATGRPWEVLDELNPTRISNRLLDTSSGARRLLARLAPHPAPNPEAVYLFSFQLVPPAWIHDKIRRQDGYESISLVDAQNRELLVLRATAVDGHRWQFGGPATEATSPLTPVCALWPHAITLCYGMDGQATLHDGASAQAPVIATAKLARPAPVAGLLITNRTGGDLAFSRISATLVSIQPGEE